MKAVVAIVVAVLAFAGCSMVTEGTVYSKEYIPSRSWTTTEPTYTYSCQTRYRSVYMNGKTSQQPYQDCQNSLVGWHQEKHFKRECFKVKFRNSDGDTGSDCVSKEEFDSINKGDFYRE